MSKSLGNSPDPIELMGKYGADGVRTGMLFSSPAGNDLLFDEKLCEQGRNFNNKIWNAFRLVKGWETAPHVQPEENKIATEWFEAKFNQSLTELNDHFSKYRLSDALMCVYKLVWDDFCSWYLEIIKPEFGKPVDQKTYNQTITFFENILKVLHPFIPFITEELWSELKPRGEKENIIVASWPVANAFNSTLLAEAQTAFDAVTQIRNVRSSKGMSPKEAVSVFCSSKTSIAFDSFVKKLANVKEVSSTETKIQSATSFLIGTQEFFIPLEGKIDVAKEREEILKDLEYQKGFLASVLRKLSNEKFVNGAPLSVIENEHKKQADAESKIKTLEERLASLE